MKHQKLIASLALATLVSHTCYADIRFNGFASIVAGIDTEDDEFRNSAYDDSIDFKPQTKFALQATADLADGLTAVAQIIARGSNNFDAEFEWAYLSYEINDTHTLRMGKLRLPFYKYSDYLDVGYAYPWISPPKAMYSLQFSTFEGLSLVSNFPVGEWDISSNFSWGNVQDTFFSTTVPTDGKLESFGGFNIQFNREWFSGYIAYLGGDVFIPHAGIEGLVSLVAAIDGEDAASTISLDGDWGDFKAIGFTIDYDNFLINAEISEVEIEESMTLAGQQWYVSFAYRFDNVMPYITYQTTESERRTAEASALSSTPLPAAVHPAQPPLNIFVQGAFDGRKFEYNAITLGIRWDFHESAALKFEYNDYQDIFEGTGPQLDDTGNFSIGIDVVF